MNFAFAVFYGLSIPLLPLRSTYRYSVFIPVGCFASNHSLKTVGKSFKPNLCCTITFPWSAGLYNSTLPLDVTSTL